MCLTVLKRKLLTVLKPKPVMLYLFWVWFVLIRHIKVWPLWYAVRMKQRYKVFGWCECFLSFLAFNFGTKKYPWKNKRKKGMLNTRTLHFLTLITGVFIPFVGQKVLCKCCIYWNKENRLLSSALLFNPGSHVFFTLPSLPVLSFPLSTPLSIRQAEFILVSPSWLCITVYCTARRTCWVMQVGTVRQSSTALWRNWRFSWKTL